MNNFGVLFTQDIWLASALSSCEVPFIKGNEIKRVTDNGREICIFNFETGKGGEEIVRQWADEKFIEQYPEHPVAYLKAFTHNRQRLLDHVKKRLQVHIENRDGKLFFIPIKSSTPQESHG